MGGAEIGGIGDVQIQNIHEILMENREAALESATERADRVILGFRRQRVFEKTFQRELANNNECIGFTEIGEGGFVPVGYHDPNVDLSAEN
ncbi:MAG: hypothetical protein QFB86_00070 [Patescibacteria group bacterium]|nr:hypothetical protein [Patescibacteria group bacterium]